MLTRTISKGFETATRTRSIEFKEDTDAVIYDPLNRTLFQGSLKALEPEQHIQVAIKDCRTKVDICVPLSPSPRPGRDPKRANSDSTVYIATVDLRRLGKCVKNGVRSGKIKNVYVLGYVPDRMGNHSDGEDGDEE